MEIHLIQECYAHKCLQVCKLGQSSYEWDLLILKENCILAHISVQEVQVWILSKVQNEPILYNLYWESWKATKERKWEGESWMIPEAMLVGLHWTYGTMQLLFPNMLIDLLRKLDVVVDLKSLKASCFPEGQQCARRHRCVCKHIP